MVRAQRTQLKLVAAALVAGTVAIACGGDSGGKDNGGTGGDTAGAGGDMAGAGGASEGALTIAFNPMFSAYDGNAHKFKVPVKVTGASGKLTVTTSPADFVDSEATAEGVMLTTRKAGECTVTIKDANGNAGTAKLTVTNNAAGDVAVGAERYGMGGVAIMLPEGGFPMFEGGLPSFEGGLPEGGIRFPEGGFPDSGITRNENAACTSCHVPEGQQADGDAIAMGQVDVEHTPQQTAGYSDDDLIKIFTEGVKPPGAKFRIINGAEAMSPIILPDDFAARIYAGFHKWSVDNATKKGIVAYLRSLTPKAQGPIDFGGLFRGGMRGGALGGAAGGGGTMDAGAP